MSGETICKNQKDLERRKRIMHLALRNAVIHAKELDYVKDDNDDNKPTCPYGEWTSKSKQKKIRKQENEFGIEPILDDDAFWEILETGEPKLHSCVFENGSEETAKFLASMNTVISNFEKMDLKKFVRLSKEAENRRKTRKVKNALYELCDDENVSMRYVLKIVKRIVHENKKKMSLIQKFKLWTRRLSEKRELTNLP